MAALLYVEIPGGLDRFRQLGICKIACQAQRPDPCIVINVGFAQKLIECDSQLRAKTHFGMLNLSITPYCPYSRLNFETKLHAAGKFAISEQGLPRCPCFLLEFTD